MNEQLTAYHSHKIGSDDHDREQSSNSDRTLSHSELNYSQSVHDEKQGKAADGGESNDEVHLQSVEFWHPVLGKLSSRPLGSGSELVKRPKYKRTIRAAVKCAQSSFCRPSSSQSSLFIGRHYIMLERISIR